MDLALPLFLLMPTADFAAIQGGQAAALHIAGAGFVQLSPVFMLAAALGTPLLLHRTRLARWRRGIAAAMVFLCLFSPLLLLDAASSSIPLSRFLTQEESTGLRKTFDIPYVTSASGAGHRLRVRCADDTPALRHHLQALGVLATDHAAR